ncbi:MAG: LysR family transcriptional regulator [Clostridiales bacterium]|nr:LysR family transcriptional regulator [Clostridiales bacterium]
MDIRQIKYFLTTARCLNFTNAAVELHISLSTLSRQITAMESELNLLLFIRDNRNVKLTRCGEFLYKQFSDLYGNYQEIVQNAQKIFAGYNGRLTIGVLEEVTLGKTVRDTIQPYLHGHPDYSLDLERRSFSGIKDGLLDMSLDFAVTFFFDISSQQSLEYRIISSDTHGILISSRHPLSHKKVFHPADFQHQTFIVISDSDSPAAMKGIIEQCKQAGFYPKLRIAPNLSTAMLWAEAGIGLAYSYSSSVSAPNPDLTFIPFAQELGPERNLVLAWNSSNTNPALPVFLKNYSKCSSNRTLK